MCYTVYAFKVFIRKESLFMAKKSNPMLYSSLIYIIIGLLLVIFKSQTLGWAMTIAGAVFVVSGTLDLLKKNYLGGGINLVIGLAILSLGWTAATIVLLVLGILIAVKGVADLFAALKQKKPAIKDLLFPIISIVVGLLLAFGNGLDILIVITGILLIVDGVVGLLGSIRK